MKKLTLITLLALSSVLCFGQIDFRNQITRQIANGDTSIHRIWNGYDTWDGTNPILVNYYDSIAFVGSRGLGIGGYTLLYNKLQVNNNQYLGNGNDTVFFNLKGHIDTVTNIIPLDSATGNLANATTKITTAYITTGKFDKISLNETGTTNSYLSIHATNAAGHNGFVTTDKTRNILTTTWAQETDTSAYSIGFTTTGKPLVNLYDYSGVPRYSFDSLGCSRFSTINDYRVYDMGGANSATVKITTNAASPAPALFIGTNRANSATEGVVVLIGTHNLTTMTNGSRMANLTFFGSANSTYNAYGSFAAIRAYVDGTVGSTADCPGLLSFATTPDGSGNPVERLKIDNTGLIKIIGNLTWQDSLYTRKESSVIADDGTITLTASQAGWGQVYSITTSTGVVTEWANFYFSEDGVVVLQTNSTNVTTTGGTDNKLNIYDGGTSAVIENKLGSNQTIKMEINYSDN